ncbi:hypothetical protein SAMN04488510_1076 [Fervidobacterium changbaicum]|uniref:Uncharacterized protein n=2 Tax=Fervidobacterium TaxID=2422 RepID=A0AAI8CL06_FERIS|nr:MULTISPECIES: hypothetical protein [Fervidobacterium]AMW32275.1 hypothetical protein NA23_02470 [Fervidobacterium islandicum]QAV32382.1 hypothetical protein CBS1_00590 [Fervidobacterium changbaicum]SDH17590.1 hypothetical protein SAMN04488510_1076 [Fervidobacterium changbaicum]
MLYTELIFAMIVLMLFLTIIAVTIPAQRETLQEAIRQERAQLIAENMFWQQISDEYLQSIQSNKFSITYDVIVDGKHYKVTINAIKFDRPKK